MVPNGTKVEDCNIGTTEDPKIVNISTNLPLESKEKYLYLLKEYSKVFSWKYEDLKVYDILVIHHTIPIKENENPFRQKLRRINPLLLPLIEKEIIKRFDTKIIVSLRHSKWIACSSSEEEKWRNKDLY